MKKCAICGGVWTCPLVSDPDVQQYIDVEMYVLISSLIDVKDIIMPEGWTLYPTHYKKRYTIYVLEPPDGYPIESQVVGSMQSGRIAAHYGASGTWVGMCKYHFYAIKKGFSEEEVEDALREAREILEYVKTIVKSKSK